MTDEPLDEINSRDCFLYVFIIFMAIVMESNSMTVIVIDSGGCDNGTTQITPFVKLYETLSANSSVYHGCHTEFLWTRISECSSAFK